MTQALDQSNPAALATGEDLQGAVLRVLRESEEPLTPSKIKDKLPTALRGGAIEETLQRQVAAQVLQQYPKYRSQQDRFWDRPMPVHVAFLIRQTLAEGPLNAAEIRRKVPAYVPQDQAEAILNEQLAQGKLFKHPKLGRGGEPIGVGPADPKEYLRKELVAVFKKLEEIGFKESQLRPSAIELLHEAEWASPKQEKQEASPVEASAPAEQ